MIPDFVRAIWHSLVRTLQMFCWPVYVKTAHELPMKKSPLISPFVVLVGGPNEFQVVNTPKRTAGNGVRTAGNGVPICYLRGMTSARVPLAHSLSCRCIFWCFINTFVVKNSLQVTGLSFPGFKWTSYDITRHPTRLSVPVYHSFVLFFWPPYWDECCWNMVRFPSFSLHMFDSDER